MLSAARTAATWFRNDLDFPCFVQTLTATAQMTYGVVVRSSVHFGVAGIAGHLRTGDESYEGQLPPDRTKVVL